MKKGVTLIEMLIAVSLLSLLSVGVLMAMRIGFTTMQKTDEHLIHNRRVINARKIIENVIQGFELTRAEWRKQQVPFLEFHPDRMRFVTAYSLQDAWRGRPQIAEIQVIPGEGGIGVRLILNETPYTGPLQSGERIIGIDEETHFAPIQPGPNSFVLADKLTYCRISYIWTDPPTRIPLGIRIDMPPSPPVIIPLTARPELIGYTDAN